VGSVDLARVPEELWLSHVERFDAWLKRGYAGNMGYLPRGRDRRADPRKVYPDAQSVVAVLSPYSTTAAGSLDPERGVRYARYLKGTDYHVDIPQRMEEAFRSLQDPELSWKICVDTSAVLERSWAALCGLGWIGKNTLLIHPKLGSYTFIGVALVNRETGHAPELLADYCGNCTRCLEGCPTQAFSAPRELDSRRCISYLTLENRKEWELPRAEWKKVDNWIAGCDVCQEVCPFNLKATKAGDARVWSPDPTALVSWADLDRENEDEYRNRVQGTALDRIQYEQHRRTLERLAPLHPADPHEDHRD
jgi:epoxyqueuosine reductase